MEPETMRSEIESTRQRLREWMVAYYTEGEPDFSEAEYEDLSARVKVLEGEAPHLLDWDSPSVQVFPPAQDPFPTRAHSAPMLSLANA